MSEAEFEKKFLECGDSPNGMECWKCTPEQNKACEGFFRDKICGNSTGRKQP